MLNNEDELNYIFESRLKKNPLFRISKIMEENEKLPLINDIKKPHALDGHKGFKRFKLKFVLERFYKIHGNKYYYDYVKYKNQKTPVRVMCSAHGEFLITPHSHWNGVGCPECKKSKKIVKQNKVRQTESKKKIIEDNKMSYVNSFLAKQEIGNMKQEDIRILLDRHYTQLRKFVKGVCQDKFHLIVNGDAGMGKTEITNEIVEKETEKTRKQPHSISGTISPVKLYGKFQDARKKGQVLIIDDTDKILEDQESLEVLKGVLDTQENKIVSWDKYSTAIQKSNKKTEFKYEGRCIIITNKWLRTAPDKEPTIQQQRLLPVLSRCHYFKAGVPNNQWKMESIKMHKQGYQSQYDDYWYELRCFKGVDEKIQEEIVEWLEEHQDNVRELSFRVCARLVQLQSQEPDFWKEMAEASECY